MTTLTIIDLLQAETELPQLEKEVLLAHVLHCSRTQLIAQSFEPVEPAMVALYESLVARRLNHEPVAYLVGHKEFYGREFVVTPDVLIPRPATEGLVDLVKQVMSNPENCEKEVDTDITVGYCVLKPDFSPTTIVDVGTGSGCIAITVALEFPTLKIIGTDLAQEALKVTEYNAEKHNVEDNCEWRHGDCLEPVADVGEPFLLVSNPPYIPDKDTLMPDVANFEPESALFAGPEGSDILTKLTEQAIGHPQCVGFALECRTKQWHEAKKRAIKPS